LRADRSQEQSLSVIEPLVAEFVIAESEQLTTGVLRLGLLHADTRFWTYASPTQMTPISKMALR
jgi:hypothetical protein